MLKISFLGAAQEVTGSCYLVTDDTTSILVDCGMFQAPKFCDDRSCEIFPFDPREVSAVFVTHAHIDHIGRIPKLVTEGFSGAIYSTEPTRALGELMLTDSVGVLMKEHRNTNQPLLYTEEDVGRAMRLWQTKNYHEPLTIGNFRITLYRAGHILGSSMILVEYEKHKILFTGDLGNPNNPLLFGPEIVSGVTEMITETTYGDRLHEDAGERKLKLERAIERSVLRGGVLMIPAFSLERTQEMLLEITTMLREKQIPSMPIFVDSPLAIGASKIYEHYMDYLNRAWAEGEIKFLKFPAIHYTPTTDDSKHINNVPPPKIIIAGSGMSTGGRILHHERRYLPDPNSTILFVGYQAAGSLGRIIQDGAEYVTIMGEKIPVRAHRETIQGYSAHPDRAALFSFVEQHADVLKKVFMTHGEPKSLLAFVQQVRDNLGIYAIAPKPGESIEL